MGRGKQRFRDGGAMSRYACHNRAPFRQTVELRNERGEVVTSFPFRMAPDCRYTRTDLGQADARCAGCKHRSTTEGTHAER